MVIYRAFRKDLISRLELDRDENFILFERLFFCGYRGTSWEPLLSVLALKYGYDIAEIPASEPPRIGGERKLRVINWGGAYYTQFWFEFFKPKKPSRQKPTDEI